MPIRVGISVQSAHPVQDVREGARWMVERAAAARRAGLDSLFVGDHHAVPIPYYQNSVIFARMLAEWRGPVAGALYLLPLWNPVLMAEQVATLASLTESRFVLQCAIGPDDNQFPALGIPAKQRPSRFEQGLEIARRLWAGELVDHSGRYELKEARLSPLPPEPIEVWIGAFAEPAVDRAARLGDGFLASPHLTLEGAREQLALYWERCDEHGRPRGTAAIRRDVYVGESAGEADATGGVVVRRGHRGFPPEACVVGDVESVAASFRALGEIGYTDVIVRNLFVDQAKAVGCIERLADVKAALA
jgi:alkanesulfonate monooxygenase SsuD/methylene tetrahydromethanopterin reductase-like flavin-dependent oxidoreductase (luciferase family)